MADQSPHAEEGRAINDLLKRRDPLSPYEVTERQLQTLETTLSNIDAEVYETVRHIIDGIRAGAPPEPVEPDTAMADINAELLERLRSTQQQRDLLDRACASYIERQAAEKAASGLITLATAHAWANEQRLLISTAMGQIANAQSALHGQEEVTLP